MRNRSKLNTTSEAVKTEMEQYICKGDHQHQPMEGTTGSKGVDGAWHSIHRTRFGGWYTDTFCDHIILDALEREEHRVIAIPAADSIAQPTRKHCCLSSDKHGLFVHEETHCGVQLHQGISSPTGPQWKQVLERVTVDLNTGAEISRQKCWNAMPKNCLLYTSPSPRDQRGSRMPSSA